MHRCVILINENNYLLASLLTSSRYNVSQSFAIDIRIFRESLHMIQILIIRQDSIKDSVQIFQLIILTSTHIYMNHRIDLPFLFHFFDSKSFEQILASLKISLKSRYKKRFSKSSRTTQKQVFGIMRQFIHKGSLIYIRVAPFYDLFKCLDSYWIFHIAHIFLQNYIFSLKLPNDSCKLFNNDKYFRNTDG